VCVCVCVYVCMRAHVPACEFIQSPKKHIHILNVHNSHINRDRIVIFSHLKSQMFKMSTTSSSALLTTCSRHSVLLLMEQWHM
jgi:hypothetical protein